MAEDLEVNSHAVRMRYFRLKQQMEGIPPNARKSGAGRKTRRKLSETDMSNRGYTASTDISKDRETDTENMEVDVEYSTTRTIAEPPVKREPSTKEEPSLKEEPFVKQELFVKQEQFVNQDPFVKAEPFVKKEPSDSSDLVSSCVKVEQSR